MARERLFDCCWVELDGIPQARLAIQVKRRPALFAIGDFLYNESGTAVAGQSDAPSISFIHATSLAHVSKSA